VPEIPLNEGKILSSSYNMLEGWQGGGELVPVGIALPFL